MRQKFFSWRLHVALLDLARGGFLIVCLIALTGWHFQSWEIALFLVSAIIPDWDFGPYFLIEKKITGLYAHGQIGHYPLLYAAVISALNISVPARIVFMVAVQIFFHFVADTINDEWGVAWLGPFSNRRLRFWQGRFQWTDQIPVWWSEMKSRQKAMTLWQAIYHRVVKKFFIIPSGEGKLFIGYLIGTIVVLTIHFLR